MFHIDCFEGAARGFGFGLVAALACSSLACGRGNVDAGGLGGDAGQSSSGMGGSGTGGSAGNDSPVGGSSGSSGSGGARSCTYQGNTFPHGSSGIMTAESCNACSCNDGAIECSQIGCGGLSCRGVPHGQTFAAGDGCNTCTCSNGELSCTLIECSNDTCLFDGVTYLNGQSFPASDSDECHHCSCQNGVVACNELPCPPRPCLIDADCSGDDYCHYRVGACAGADAGVTTDAGSADAAASGSPSPPAFEPGVCERKAVGCPNILAPICGCDGQTYDNSCFAAAVGVSVLAVGACAP